MSMQADEEAIDVVDEGDDKLLEVCDLSVVFNDNVILKNINLTIQRGQTVAIIGESGCGKSGRCQCDRAGGSNDF